MKISCPRYIDLFKDFYTEFDIISLHLHGSLVSMTPVTPGRIKRECRESRQQFPLL
jgi:hypothetical protein